MAPKKKKRIISKQKNLPDTSKKINSKIDKSTGVFENLSKSFEKIFVFIKRYSLWIEIIALIMVIATGILFRLEDLEQWRKYEQRAFFDKQPLHTTFDAWFYLSLAQDLVDGTYSPIDEKRGVPDCPPRPTPPPLISVMAASIAKTTSFSMSWIGAVMPAVLGPLLAIPLYLLGRFYGGPIMGIVAALMALIYPFYIYRSNIGRFDTDCMNITWATAAAYLFLLFGIKKTKIKYFYFLGGFAVFALFLWWWDQAPAAVTAITLMPLGIALAFFYRPNKREGLIFYGIIGFAAIVFLLVKGPAIPLKLFSALWSKFLYISKESSGDFPNIGLTISEQKSPTLDFIVTQTTTNILAFIFGIAGILLLLWKRFKITLFLVSMISLSTASFFANRFLIFLVPVLALGTGYSMLTLWALLKRYKPLHVIVCGLLTFALIWPLYQRNKAYTQWPKELGSTARGMNEARKITPSDAVIWAWWDHGYALTYLARRPTVNDGSIHSGERTVYTAIPFITDDYRLSANFMHFYVIRGVKGINKFYKAVGNDSSAGLKLIKNILGAGPENAREIIKKADLKEVDEWRSDNDWLRFFFPPQKRPVYLFLDNLLTRIITTVYWFGSWDIEKKEGQHPYYKPYFNIRTRKGRLVGSNSLSINTKTGEMIKPRIILSHLVMRKGKTMKEKSYNNNNPYRFEYFVRAGFGALMDNNGIADTIFNLLFIRHTYPEKYFRPVQLRSPSYQIWEVRGDSISD